MADITKCCNKNCKIKEQCYRFTAKSNPYWQSFANFNDGKKIADKKECSSFYLDRRAKKSEKNK